MMKHEKKLSSDDAAGMTVNERLYHAGFLSDFYLAIERRDAGSVRRILQQIYLNDENIEAILKSKLDK